jgi:hypothetical protein
VSDLVTAVYIGGDQLQTADGTVILPGDRLEMPADMVDQPGSPWASRVPHGQAERLRLLAGNITAAATGAETTPDPLAADAASAQE